MLAGSLANDMSDRVLNRVRACGLAILLFLSIEVIAEPVAYVDLALGLGVHVLEGSSQGSDQGAASELIKTGVGVQWLSFLSTQVGIWSWSSEGQSKRESGDESVDDAEEDDIGSFEGLSASWEVALQWPIENENALLSAGPYYRYGRHCWTAVLTGLVQPWSKKGCSDLNTLGFSFPVGKERNAGMYLEFTQTNFDDLHSSSLQLGAKLAF